MELRGNPDGLHDCVRSAFQSGDQRSWKCEPTFDVWKRPVRASVQQRIGPAVEEPGHVDKSVLSIFPCRPDPYPNTIYGWAKRLQRADHRQRADVPGTSHAGSSDRIGDLSRTISFVHEAELHS